ncbi:MAG: Sua5/YciO/YrdC/YwlC family protein, partial [Armatimonadota bacterium]|nr:Sua5/YciO/YrdC/YwlC family protein [Armatimonadota bacterium]
MAHELITPSAIEIIRRGGLVIFPTETLYGLGCVATNEQALRRLFEVKGRAPGQPPPVLVADHEQLFHLVTTLPDAAVELIQNYWPGALTLV